MTHPVDLFGSGRTKAVLRWLVVPGSVPRWEFKHRHVALGGTENSTHVFDRYMIGRMHIRRTSYVPRSGSHGLIETIDRPIGRGTWERRVHWVGSEGTAFAGRAAHWLAHFDLARLDLTYQACERLITNPLDGTDEVVCLAWLTEITTEIQRRADARKEAA